MRHQTCFRRSAALSLAGLLVALSVSGFGLARRLIGNTIDPHATLIDHGRIVLTGPISCSQEEWVDMRVTVTQRSTGALAEGRLRFVGTTEEQHWTIEATAIGKAEFEEGPATAVAVAVTSLHGETTDAHQWLVPITVEREP
jgi:hypothetical protein